MEHGSGAQGREMAIEALFRDAFASSEGAEEGALIGGLAAAMMGGTPPEDLFVFSSLEGGTVLGAIMLSRLVYDADARTVFLLSPVAVHPERQGEGIGQGLIRHGLAEMGRAGVDLVMTYGDPAFYGKVGFRPISERFAKAPFTLSQPHGWLGAPLKGGEPAPLAGPSRCVEALNRPELW